MIACYTSLSRAGLGWTLLSGTGLDLLLLVVHLVPGLGGLALLRVCWARLRLNSKLWIQEVTLGWRIVDLYQP